MDIATSCLSSVNATICILTHTAIVEYVAQSFVRERKHLDRISESRGGEAHGVTRELGGDRIFQPRRMSI